MSDIYEKKMSADAIDENMCCSVWCSVCCTVCCTVCCNVRLSVCCRVCCSAQFNERSIRQEGVG